MRLSSALSAAALAPSVALASTFPCGQITAKIVELKKNTTDNDEPPKSITVDPEIANACLESSSIDNGLAQKYAVELKKYLEFQSTLAFLKDPPADYPYPPVDLLDGIDKIAHKASKGGYKSQYEFDQALQSLLVQAHEGHLGISPCTGSSILYERGVSLLSLSKDGRQIPEIYVLDDVQPPQKKNASTVVSVNGQPVNAFLAKEALLGIADPDASWNMLFYNVGQEPTIGVPLGRVTVPGANYYPGPFTNLTFSNGSTASFPTKAIVSQPFETWDEDITDGKSFTDVFCIKPAKAPTSSAPASSSTPTPTSAPTETLPKPLATMLGHPFPPVVKDPNNAIAGYFLNGSQYEDTAVLYVASFLNEQFANGTTAPATFSNTSKRFLEECKKANKKKLLIDLSGNGGGNTLLPNELFGRLFPDIEPYGAGRLRIGDAANIYGSTIGDVSDDDIDTGDEEQDAAIKKLIQVSPWNYRYALTTDLKNLTSWSDFYPPNVQHGDNFTIDVRMALNDTDYDVAIDNIIPYGVAGQPVGPRPFEPENIVILTDGVCASACSIFTEFMTRQAGIKTIAVGGRPKKGPMQAIGGTKGSLAFPFASLQQATEITQELIEDDLVELANKTLPGIEDLPLGSPDALSKFSLNMRDNMAPKKDGSDDESATPLQFVVEPADCRLFYTAETAFDASALWAHAVDVAWSGKPCAWGKVDTNSSGTLTGDSPSQTSPISAAAVTSVGQGLVAVAVAAGAMLL